MPPDNNTIAPICGLIFLALILYVVIRLATRPHAPRRRPTFGGSVPSPVPQHQPPRHEPAAFPVVSRTSTLPPVPPLANLAPTKFLVTGVDKESRMDCTGVYEAATPANAKVKAELDGVVVTAVEPA